MIAKLSGLTLIVAASVLCVPLPLLAQVAPSSGAVPSAPSTIPAARPPKAVMGQRSGAIPPQRNFILGVQALTLGLKSSTSKLSGSTTGATGVVVESESKTCKDSSTEFTGIPVSFFTSMIGFVRFLTAKWVFGAALEPYYTADVNRFPSGCDTSSLGLLGLDRVPTFRVGYLVAPFLETGLMSRISWSSQKLDEKESSSSFVDAGPYVRARGEFSSSMGWEAGLALFARSSSSEEKETKTPVGSSSGGGNGSGSSGGTSTTPSKTETKETEKESGFGSNASAHILFRLTDTVELGSGLSLMYLSAKSEFEEVKSANDKKTTEKKKNEATWTNFTLELLQLRANF